jgi:hypothetical protein
MGNLLKCDLPDMVLYCVFAHTATENGFIRAGRLNGHVNRKKRQGGLSFGERIGRAAHRYGGEAGHLLPFRSGHEADKCILQ